MTSISLPSDTISVGIVLSALQNKGPVNVVRAQIANRLDKKIKYIVILLGNNVEQSIVDELQARNVTFHTLKGKGFLHQAKVLSDFVRQNQISVLHSHGATADLVTAFAKTRATKFTTVHNRLLEDYIPLFGYLRGCAYFLVHFLAYLLIPYRIACSTAVGDALAKYRLAHQVIANGVDTSVYFPVSPERREELRKKYRLSETGTNYIYCGSFIKRKNVEFLLKFLKLEPSDVFVLAGEGELLDECRTMVRGDDRYRFLGQISACAELYQASDCFVSSSKSEGLPLAVLEAYSCGARLLLSDIPSHREIAAKCGSDVQLFSISDSEGCTQQITLPDESSERSASVFSAERMAAGYESFYNKFTYGV